MQGIRLYWDYKLFEGEGEEDFDYEVVLHTENVRGCEGFELDLGGEQLSGLADNLVEWVDSGWTEGKPYAGFSGMGAGELLEALRSSGNLGAAVCDMVNDDPSLHEDMMSGVWALAAHVISEELGLTGEDEV